MRTKAKTNPAFYGDELRLALADQPGRLERALRERDSADLLTWNIFASLDTHSDRDWLAHRLQALGGSSVRAPVRLSLWTGRDREPLLRPSRQYVAWVRERSRDAGGADGSTAEFERPIEAPVRIESPDVLVLVDTGLHGVPRGGGGRDRLLELIDAGIDHARRLDKALAVATVYPAGSDANAELSKRVHRLRSPQALAAEMPHRPSLPPVLLREVTWQELLAMWETEVDYLTLGGQPVKAFREHVRRLGLR